MAKFVLVYPQFPVREGPRFNVPMGPLHLGTYLESKGIKVEFIDCNIENGYFDVLRKELTDALCLGISAMTAQLPSALEICRQVKNEFGNLPIIFGGVHATLFPEQTVKDPLIDYAVVGEGELPLLSLIHAIQNREVPERVGGIAYLDDKGMARVNPQNQEFNFEELPLVNYHLLSHKVIEQFPANYVGMLTSRGCPYRCSFCINSILKENRRWRAWGAKRVAEEIGFLAKLGCHKIYFWDEIFFLSKRRLEEILKEIEIRGLEFEWFANVRADYFRKNYLDSEFLKRLYKAGCRRFGIGAESGSQKILDSLQKGISVEDITVSARSCEESKIRPTYSFMIGMPKEEREDIKETVKIIGELMNLCHDARILGPQLFRPYPGTKLYFECLENGLKEPATIEEWAKKIATEFMESSLFKMPWIKDTKFVNTVWFYSLLLSTSYKRLVRLWVEYCQVYKLKKVMYVIGIIGIILVAFAGRLRYKLNFHKFHLETKLLKRYRAVISY